jgi:hypothetical protein
VHVESGDRRELRRESRGKPGVEQAVQPPRGYLGPVGLDKSHALYVSRGDGGLTELAGKNQACGDTNTS